MRFSFTLLLAALALSVLALAAPPVARQALADDSPQFDVYGFAHFDYIQDFKRVNPAWAATLRPSRIPTTEGLYGSDGQAILSARQSRLGAKGTLPTDNGAVFTKFEFDLFGVGPDEGQTTIRLRHAYGEWNGWLAGQTNSLFMDIDLFPNVVDYWGPAGMVFLRNPQLRRTWDMGENKFALALEHPSGDIDVGQIREFDPALGASIVPDNKVPDLTAQVNIPKPWGHFQVAAIARRLGFETMGTPGNQPHGSELGAGADVSLVLKNVRKNKIMLGGVFGNGVSMYMNDGGMDLAPDQTVSGPQAKAVPLQGYIAYIDHTWNEKFSTSLGYSRTQVTNTSLQTADAFRYGEYASANLIYYPTKKVFFAAEGLYGRRVDNGGNEGEDSRVQISAHYDFSSADFR